MGTRLQSIAFPYEKTNDELIKLVKSWFFNPLFKNEIIDYSQIGIERRGNTVVVYNFPVFKILDNPACWENILDESGIIFDWFIVLLCITSMDNYGYALYEKNNNIKTAYDYFDNDAPIFIGEMLDIEKPYFNAQHYFIHIDDDEESNKIYTISEKESDSYREFLDLENGEQVEYRSMVECLMMELSMQYLNVNIAWDLFDYDFSIKIDNSKYVPLEEKHVKKNKKNLFSWFKNINLFK